MNSPIDRKLPLKGREISLDSSAISAEYSARLLRSLGATVETRSDFSGLDVARDWASSGLVSLTGYPTTPMQGPAAIPSAARGALDALKLLAGQNKLVGLDGAALLSERAAFLGLERQGQISANGSCRLLSATDGWIALNLARDTDWSLLPAWLESPVLTWSTVTRKVRQKPVSLLLERGRLLGLPVAPTATACASSESWYSIAAQAAPALANRGLHPLVVDLSSLWAGPLCTHLLSLAGARVIKVESVKRPDGARRGNTGFYDLLNAGKQSVAFDLSADSGRGQLLSLLAKADIVLEGSRPRALQQLGIDARALVEQVPGLTWISITGYGRADPMANWVAFGEDAAAAAGVTAATATPPLFCGDALADPLAGIHAAFAAMAFWQGGGGVLVDISLRDIAAHCLSFYPGVNRGLVAMRRGEWRLVYNDCELEVKFPAMRRPASPAVAFGSDTQAILNEFHIPC